ncbi:hypothetical protein [Spiroplasma endosymbiont of Crioceris asparagi]|uniref:hypothetical protein n=1 Tax=Spiroplasma endosymbiont of Crioceris asparagi TaxID=3066286 RepID=UPI0030D2A284
MKKLIVGLAAVIAGAIGIKFLISSTGISFSALMARRVSTDEYKGYFQFNPISLSSGKTMQASDFEQLADLQSPLVGVDELGNSKTDLALKNVYLTANANKVEQKVGFRQLGKDAANKKESWTYAIDPNAKWVDNDGNYVTDDKLVDNNGQISGKDFVNIFLYVLNPNVDSDISSFFANFIDGFSELKDYVATHDVSGVKKKNSVGAEEKDKDKIVTENWERIKQAYEVATKGKDSFDGKLKFTDDSGEQTFDLGIVYGKINGTDAGGVNINTATPGSNIDGASYVRFINPDGITTPFFEGIMSYVIFAPMPKKAIDEKYILNYGLPGEFSATLYTGAYTLTNYSPNNNLSFKKNEHYVNAEDIKIKHIQKFYKANVTPSDLRVSFEAGDLTEDSLSVTDGGGWNKYVGSDYKNPKFEAVFSQEPVQSSSFGIFFNPINTDTNGNGNKKEKAELLSSSLIRSYFTTRFNRDYSAKYYSSKFDAKGADSAAGINFWTASNFINDGEKDYSDYMKDEVATEAKKDNSVSNIESLKNNLEQGHNFFQKEDGKKYIEERAKKSNKISNDYTQDIIDEVKNIDPSATTSNPLELKLLLNVSQKYALNMSVTNSIRMFNKVAARENVPLKIDINESKDQSDFMNKRSSGSYDLLITGWSPDYADPLTYAVFGATGDMNTYYGIARILDSHKLPVLQKIYDKKWNAQGTWDFSKNSIDDREDLLSYDEIKGAFNKTINDNYASDNNTWKANITKYVNQNLKYSQLVYLASKIADIQARYKAFAQIEAYALYSSCITLPIDDQFLPALVKISYVRPFEYSTAKYGTSQYQHRNWTILNKLPNKSDLQKWLQEFEDKKKNNKPQ